jgi:hypothetical protein
MKHTRLIAVATVLVLLLVVPVMGAELKIITGGNGAACQVLTGYVTLGNPVNPVWIEPQYQMVAAGPDGCLSDSVILPTVTSVKEQNVVLPDPFRSNPADRALDDYIRSVFVI